MKVYIYILKDPDTQEVRYVGKSVRPKRRYSEHIYKKYQENKKTHLAHWLLKLLNQDKKPIMEIIDQTEGDWEILEKKWIAFYSNLCNHTLGGGGCHGIIQSKEILEKRSKSMLGKNKGKTMPEDFKKKLSSTLKDTGLHRGTNNPNSKYSKEQIENVKKYLKEFSYLSGVNIARICKVHPQLVYEIKNGTKHRD